jgi:hypothetical protein
MHFHNTPLRIPKYTIAIPKYTIAAVFGKFVDDYALVEKHEKIVFGGGCTTSLPDTGKPTTKKRFRRVRRYASTIRNCV